MQVNVLLVDVLDATKFGSCRADIVTRVKALYEDCFAYANRTIKPPPNHTVSVSFVSQKPTPSDTDYVLYFLPAMFWSIITYKEIGTKQSNLLNDHWGYTTKSGSAGAGLGAAGSSKSEVICRSIDGSILGSLVFHEMLHAKTFKDNRTLHASGGLGAATVEGTTQLNNTNRQDTIGTLAKKVTQWTGGWEILHNAKRARDAGDPAWNLF
ncbi:hypothetical protein [uncultured Thiocystis sp.]|jgi:hypothetical protein|uniref:hypothetical protein n=1 Tax=uncultured Thiocystis sp. TaxID=1202134 RepID=UPI0025F9BDA4|nr:hypothetical protein [uncultured Thiocystis sp.]